MIGSLVAPWPRINFQDPERIRNSARDGKIDESYPTDLRDKRRSDLLAVTVTGALFTDLGLDIMLKIVTNPTRRIMPPIIPKAMSAI